MSEPLEDAYFTWLYSQVASVRDRVKARTYWNLLKLLHEKEFFWLIANDDNRVDAGISLRQEFLNDGVYDASEEWAFMECSFLEMLIAFSVQIANYTEGEPRSWFWHMIQNLGLEHKTDAYALAPHMREDIMETIDRVVERTYDPNGHGGLFPLANPTKDQRTVELWYQVNAYLIERDS